MDEAFYKKVVDKVYKRYPEFNGAKPKIRVQKPEGSIPAGSENYLFTFQKKVTVGGGQALDRWVRVVVDKNGKIIKVSTSR
jgi:hypothetical protein